MARNVFVLVGLAILVAAGFGYRTGLIYEDLAQTRPERQSPVTAALAGSPKADSVDSIDLSDEMPPIGNQGPQGSCAAWAMGYYHKSHTEFVEHQWNVEDSNHQSSPAFVYNQVNGGVDQGSGFADISDLICESGCASMADHPYDHWNYTRWPSETAYSTAIPYRGDRWYWIGMSEPAGLEEVKQRLCNGYTTALGIWCWQNFVNVHQFGNIYCVADKYGSNLGGHGVCIVGFNDSLQTNGGMGAFRLTNSWGRDWGDSGFFWMSYEAVMDEDLSQQVCAYITDRIAYEPKLLARVKVTHPSREKVGLRLGAGSIYWPLWQHNFRAWRRPRANRPFPDYNMVFDISEAESLLVSGAVDTLFFTAFDGHQDGMSGTISYFAVEHPDSQLVAVSTDPPVEIPDYDWAGASAYVILFPGVEEGCSTPHASRRTPNATIVRSVLFLPLTLEPSNPWTLFSFSGRNVMDLAPGENDVSRLAPGVYFIREHSVVGSQHSGPSGVKRDASGVRKVVIQG